MLPGFRFKQIDSMNTSLLVEKKKGFCFVDQLSDFVIDGREKCGRFVVSFELDPGTQPD